jgi:hypothetical protein
MTVYTWNYLFYDKKISRNICSTLQQNTEKYQLYNCKYWTILFDSKHKKIPALLQ